MGVTGATLKIGGSVQAAMNGLDLVTWPDSEGRGQAFIEALSADLSDFELTADEAGTTPVPWRLPDASCWVPGTRLTVRTKLASTGVWGWAGCTDAVGQNDGTGVVSAAASVYWGMEGDGTGGITDWVAGCTATPTAAVSTADGVVGKCREWGAGGPYFSTDFSFGMSAGDKFQYSLWMQRITYESGATIWATGRSGNSVVDVNHTFSTANHYVRDLDKNGISGFRSTALPIGSWVHIALTYDGSTARMYLDGVPNNTQAGIAMTNSIPVMNMKIGAFEANRFSYGLLDEMMLSVNPAAVWTAEEVAARYAMENAPTTWVTWGAEEAVGGAYPWRRVFIARNAPPGVVIPERRPPGTVIVPKRPPGVVIAPDRR